MEMTEPSDKSQQMNDDLESISFTLNGRSRIGSIKSDTCVSCGEEAKEFSDELSRKEFSISGLCQVCQDAVFQPPDELEDYDVPYNDEHGVY